MASLTLKGHLASDDQTVDLGKLVSHLNDFFDSIDKSDGTESDGLYLKPETGGCYFK